MLGEPLGGSPLSLRAPPPPQAASADPAVQEPVSPASCCSKSESVFKRQAPGGWQAGTAAVASLALTLPTPYPRMPIHPPGLRTLDSELRAESWMELWMGRGALTLYTPRNSFVGRCEGWGLLAQPGHPAQGATSDFPPSLCGPENSVAWGGGCLLSEPPCSALGSCVL